MTPGRIHPIRTPLLALALATLPLGAARAEAVFDASATSRITFAGLSAGGSALNAVPADLTTDHVGSVFNEFTSTSGVATASAVGSATPAVLSALGLGDFVDQSAVAGGSAVGEATATVLVQTDGTLTFVNTSTTTTYVIDLLVSYAVSAATSVSSAGDVASAAASVFVEFRRGTDPNALALIDELFDAVGVFGVDTGAASATPTFSIELAPGETLVVTAFTDASGVVTSVPEPHSLALAGLGLGATAWAARRRRRAIAR